MKRQEVDSGHRPAGLWLLSCVLLALASTACEDTTSPEDTSSVAADSDSSVAPAAGLDGPEGIKVVQDRVLVTNTCAQLDDATGTMTYGNGYVSALDIDSLEELGRLYTPWLNPQSLVILPGLGGGEAGARAGPAESAAEDRLAVVCSGRLAADDSGRMVAQSPGGVLVITPDTLEILGQVEIPTGMPGPLGGFPGSAAFDADTDALFVGSGVGPYVYRVSPGSLTVTATFTVHPESDTNDLMVPALAGGTLYVSSQRTGKLYRLNPTTGAPIADPLDVTKTDAYEGPIDIAVAGNTLYVLSTISSRVAAVDLASGKVDFPLSAGAAPNRLLFHEGVLYVVNSLDNNLTRFDPSTGMLTSPFAPLPVGTNPWEMAAQGDTAYITGYLDDTVHAISLSGGGILATAH